MEKSKRSTGGRCGVGVVLLVVSIVSLAGGFIAGKIVGDGSGGSIPIKKASTLTTQEAVVHLVAGTAVAVSSMQQGARPWKGGPICSNTCAKAKDGVCDDGRVGKSDQKKEAHMAPFEPMALVHCDLGTDCADCGDWTPSGEPTWIANKAQGPIALLKQKGIEIRVKASGPTLHAEVPFRFAYTDPVKDVDVSAGMEHSGMVEPIITKIFHRILKGGCTKAGGGRALFADVGGNFGWFTIIAATLGCRVLAFEPVPHFKAFLDFNVHLNDLQTLVDVRPHVVSHVSGQTMKMVVPSTGIWGTAGIDGLNIDKNIPGVSESIDVMSVQLNEVVKEDLLLLKVDVEGWEWSVMKGADQILTKYDIQNIVMEYSPGVPERNFKFTEIIATVQMLVDLHGSGFKIGHIEAKSDSSPLEEAMKPFPAITPHNLKYDLHDAVLFKNSTLGCPLPEELLPFISRCGAVPEQLNPRSLRSNLGHNTNIWAAKTGKLMRLEGTVGILQLTDSPETYFIPEGAEWGMGQRRCKDMDPQWQVRHRCRCTNLTVCGIEQELLTKLANQGKLSFNYMLP